MNNLFQKIKFNKTHLVYLSSALLGLALAHITLSVAFLTVQSKFKKKINISTTSSASKSSSSYSSASLSSIVGGLLFPQAAIDTSEVATNTEEVLEFKLLGTLEGPRSIATAIVFVSGSKTGNQEFKIGQKIGNAKILAIRRNYIWVYQSGQRLKVKVGEKNEPPPAEVKNTSTQPVVASAGKTITKVLSREKVNKEILGNAANIYKGASFGPKLENGKIVGYKIHKVKPGHIFYTLGARSGDIIKKINGYGLSDTERMFELWKSMKTADRAKIEILRNSKILTYDFHIRN